MSDLCECSSLIETNMSKENNASRIDIDSLEYVGSPLSSAVSVAFLPIVIAAFVWTPFMWKVAFICAVGMILVVLGNQRTSRSAEDMPEVVEEFHMKHRWKMEHILFGMTLPSWLDLLYHRWRYIDWATYSHKVLIITVMACVSSVLSFIQHMRYGVAIRRTNINRRPVFILGHPRTGTTHLANLFSQDDQGFNFPTTLECTQPSTALILRNYKDYVSGSLPETRPMDKMKLGLDLPQEDELALQCMTGGRSAYMMLNLMNAEPEFRKYFTFEDAAPEERDLWLTSFAEFLRRVTFAARDRNPKSDRLVLKSPCHIARIELLNQLFPEAEYIYIHRNPYEVWKSAANMADKMYWYTYLAKPRNEDVTEFILNQHEMLFDAYLKTKELIPKERLHVISFEELTRDTIQTMKGIYEHFGWESWATAEKNMTSYIKSLGTFKQNDFVPVAEPMKSYLQTRWSRAFQEFGYSK